MACTTPRSPVVRPLAAATLSCLSRGCQPLAFAGARPRLGIRRPITPPRVGMTGALARACAASESATVWDGGAGRSSGLASDPPGELDGCSEGRSGLLVRSGGGLQNATERVGREAGIERRMLASAATPLQHPLRHIFGLLRMDLTPNEARMPRTPNNRVHRAALRMLHKCASEVVPRMAIPHHRQAP